MLLDAADVTYSTTFVMPARGYVEAGLWDVRCALAQAAAACDEAAARHAGVSERAAREGAFPFAEWSFVSIPSNPDALVRELERTPAGSRDDQTDALSASLFSFRLGSLRLAGSSPWPLSQHDAGRYTLRPAGAKLFVPRGRDGRSQPAAGVAWFTDPAGRRHHRVAALAAHQRHRAHTPFGDGGTVAKARPDELIYPHLYRRLAYTGGDGWAGVAEAVLMGDDDPLAVGLLADAAEAAGHPDAPALRRAWDRLCG
jgi:hypothetical protein